MPVFHIDDQPVEFQPGEKILSAALRNGKKIPHYCYHPGMSIVATCRMCVVDIVDLGNGVLLQNFKLLVRLMQQKE